MSDSSFIPNSFQTPNALVDQVMPLLTSDEWVVLSYATRHILGFQDTLSVRMRRMSVSMFENGYGGYSGCGLGRETIIKVLKSLDQYGLLKKVGKATDEGQMFRIAYDSSINFEALHERWQGWQDVANRRTEGARNAKERKRNTKLFWEFLLQICRLDSEPSVAQTTFTGLSDRLVEAVCGTDQQRSVGQTDSGLSDRRNQTQLQTQFSKPIAAAFVVDEVDDVDVQQPASTLQIQPSALPETSEPPSKVPPKVSPPDEDFAAVVTEFHTRIGGTLTLVNTDDIKDALGEFGRAVVLKAIEIAQEQRGRSWNYVRTILNDPRNAQRLGIVQAKPNTPRTTHYYKRRPGIDPDAYLDPDAPEEE